MRRFALALAAAAALQGQDWVGELDRADALLDRGRYEESAAAARAVAARHTGDERARARALNIAGAAALYLARYNEAATDFRAALNAARRSGDRNREIGLLNNLGNVDFFTGRYSEALARYVEAERAVASSPAEPWLPRRRRLTMTNLAALYEQTGRHRKALEYYKASVAGELADAEQAQVLVNQGTLYRQLGDAPKALGFYRAAAALFRKQSHADGEISVLQSTGIVEALDFGDYQKAARSFAEALRLAERGGNARRIAVAHLLAGVAMEKLGDKTVAAAHFSSAAGVASRAALPDEHWEALFGQGRLAGDEDEALRYFERAITVIESMREGLDAPALRAEFLANKRDVYDAAIGVLLRQRNPSAPALFALMEQSRARALRDKVGRSKAQPLEEVQNRLQERSVLAEVWTGRSRYALLMITRRDVKLYHGAWSALEAERFAKSLTVPGGAPKTVIPWFTRAIPKDISSLIISPDGPLHLLPFEAILDEVSTPLIARFPISYLPAASLLSMKQPEAISPLKPRIAVFAEPLPSEQEPRPLPFSGVEARSIVSLLPGRSLVHTGESNVKSKLDASAGLLHFATHATVDLSEPDLSRIAFSRGEYLYRREIEALDFSGVDLVTLSACDTERGRIVRGEGVQSFSRAFLGAGAQSTVTTLWRIADGPTAEFMKQFYYRLGRGESKAEALRGAKLAMLQSNTIFRDPYFWAAFVLNGDGASPVPPLSLAIPVALGLAVLAVASAYYNRRNAPPR